MEYLKKIDLFAVPYMVQTIQGKRVYQTKFGGCATILIYSLILAYMVITLKSWADGSMVSKITTVNSNMNANTSSTLMSITAKLRIRDYWDYKWHQSIDKQYFIVSYDEGDITIPYQDDAFYPQLDFSYLNNNSIASTNQIYINLLRCRSDLVLNGTCASEQEIEDLLKNRALYIALDLNFTIVDPNTFKKSEIQKLYWQGIDNEWCKVSTLQLDATEYTLQTGSLFSEPQTITTLSGATYTIESQTQRYCQLTEFTDKTDPPSILGIYFFSLEHISYKTTIQYPSLFDVVGNIGAIGQVILLVKFIIYEYNHYAQNLEMVEVLAKFLYPELPEIKKKKRFFKCKSVMFRDMEVETLSFFKFRDKLAEFIRLNLSFKNIVINQFKLTNFLQNGEAKFEGFRIAIDGNSGQSQIISKHIEDFTQFQNQHDLAQSFRVALSESRNQSKIPFKDRVVEDDDLSDRGYIIAPNSLPRSQILNSIQQRGIQIPRST